MNVCLVRMYTRDTTGFETVMEACTTTQERERSRTGRTRANTEAVRNEGGSSRNRKDVRTAIERLMKILFAEDIGRKKKELCTQIVLFREGRLSEFYRNARKQSRIF